MTKHEDEVTMMKVNERKDSLIGVDSHSQQDRQSHTWLRVSLALSKSTLSAEQKMLRVK